MEEPGGLEEERRGGKVDAGGVEFFCCASR